MRTVTSILGCFISLRGIILKDDTCPFFFHTGSTPMSDIISAIISPSAAMMSPVIHWKATESGYSPSSSRYFSMRASANLVPTLHDAVVGTLLGSNE